MTRICRILSEIVMRGVRVLEGLFAVGSVKRMVLLPAVLTLGSHWYDGLPVWGGDGDMTGWVVLL